MWRVFLSGLLAANLGFADLALAQCAFDQPQKAAIYQTSFVRAFRDCPSDGYPPNATSTAGASGSMAACAPPETLSSYQFSEKGRCLLSAKSKVEQPCSTFPSRDCLNVFFTLKCSGLLDSAEVPATTPFRLALTVAVTQDDPSNGDLTQIAFPFQLSATAQNGKLSLKSTLSAFLDSVGLAPQPPCSTIPFLDMFIQDVGGNVFAVPGMSGRSF